MLFATTAWSYAEAASLYPEAGGSSSFARHAFNEAVSFGAGWAIVLDYIVTIAISAFFVPSYLAVFLATLKAWPYNTIVGLARSFGQHCRSLPGVTVFRLCPS